MRKNKQLSIAAVMVLLLCFAACAAKRPYKERSSLAIADNSVCRIDMKAEVTGKNKIRLTFENKSDKTCMYGNPYKIEYYSEGNWYKVPFNKDAGIFTMEGILLGPAEEYAQKDNEDYMISSTNSMDVELSGMGELCAGHYRIVKDFSILDVDGSPVETFYLAAEFDLSGY